MWQHLEVADFTGNLIGSIQDVRVLLNFVRLDLIKVFAVKDNPLFNF